MEKHYWGQTYIMDEEIGRTDTIPKVENGQGISLLSGFSQNAMKIATNKEKKMLMKV